MHAEDTHTLESRSTYGKIVRVQTRYFFMLSSVLEDRDRDFVKHSHKCSRPVGSEQGLDRVPSALFMRASEVRSRCSWGAKAPRTKTKWAPTEHV